MSSFQKVGSKQTFDWNFVMVMKLVSGVGLAVTFTAAMMVPSGAAGLVKLPAAALPVPPLLINVAAPKIVPVARGVKQYFQPHVYTGGRFSRKMARQAGLPDAQIVDRRNSVGDVYQCSFVTLRGQKAIVCD